MKSLFMDRKQQKKRIVKPKIKFINYNSRVKLKNEYIIIIKNLYSSL